MKEIMRKSIKQQMVDDLVESFSYQDDIWEKKLPENVKVEDFYIDFYDKNEKKIYDCMDFDSIKDPEEKNDYLWGTIDELEPLFEEALKLAKEEFSIQENK